MLQCYTYPSILAKKVLQKIQYCSNEKANKVSVLDEKLANKIKTYTLLVRYSFIRVKSEIMKRRVLVNTD